jgi:hypothetical protein
LRRGGSKRKLKPIRGEVELEEQQMYEGGECLERGL